MNYRLAIEDIEPNHYIAWALDLPGCFSGAATVTDAVRQAPQCIAAYYVWLAANDPALPSAVGPFDTEVVETFQAFASPHDPEYVVNACFNDDKRPLTYWDVAIALRLLEWSRKDLINSIADLTPRQLYQPIAGERQQTLAGILTHVALAENWYLKQLGYAHDRQTLSVDPREQLTVVRQHARAQLPQLIGDTRVTKNYDEEWTARKMIRRMLWHERDHTQQIAAARIMLAL